MEHLAGGRRLDRHQALWPIRIRAAGREMLWSALDKETKYKAKNFVDVPVYRAADALFAQADQGIRGLGSERRPSAIVGAVAAAVWAVNGWWLGRRYETAAVQERADLT
jgi:AAA family ATP:ADP antiporter